VPGADLESEVAKTADAAGGPTQTATAKEDKQAAKDAAALQSRIRELEAESRFWAEKAQGIKPAEAPKKDDGPDELDALLAEAGVDGDTAASLLDDLGEKGVAALEKRGLVTKAQLKQILSLAMTKMEAKANSIAESRVDGAKNQFTAEAKLLKDFPDLADEKSEFAKETAREFAAMVADDPSLKNSYVALRAAARMASQKRTSGGGGELSSRMQRIAAQSPTRGGRQAASEFDDDDVEITPEARTILAHAARYGVTEDSYRKHARRNN
jgi:hypothetical protein